MVRNYFMELANYTQWADKRVMEWLNQISDELWNQVITSSFSSIRETAIHIVSAEKIWIDFWQNTPDPVYLSSEFKGTKEELITIWKRTSAGLVDVIASYPEGDYEKEIAFRYPDGRVGYMEFWQTFPHCVNHSTYHRGQLVTLLRQMGFTKLSSIDLATYYVLNQA